MDGFFMFDTFSLFHARKAGALTVVAMTAMLMACSNEVPGERDFKTEETGYAAVANGRVDVEGGLVAVAAKTPGVVEAVYASEGDRVSKGQILARLNFDDETAAIDESDAQLRLAQAQLGYARVESVATAREYRRVARLRGTGAVSGQLIDKTRDTADLAHFKHLERAAQVNAARAARARTLLARDRKTITSPVDGIIAQSFATPGAGVSTLNVSTLFVIAPIAPRIVRAEVTDNALQSVKVGQPVEIFQEGSKSKPIPGTVRRISPVFGARFLQSDTASQRTDERVVGVVIATDDLAIPIGKRVLVRFKYVPDRKESVSGDRRHNGRAGPVFAALDAAVSHIMEAHGLSIRPGAATAPSPRFEKLPVQLGMFRQDAGQNRYRIRFNPLSKTADTQVIRQFICSSQIRWIPLLHTAYLC
jgi:HlyD family secretion protein